MGKFRLPSGEIINLPDRASKGTVVKAAPRAARTTNRLHGQADLEKLIKAEVAKQTSGAVAKAVAKEAQERADKFEALEKAARDWRQKAQNGRITGLDPEIRSLYVRKAEAAEAEAERLRSGNLPKADLAKSARLEAEADAYAKKASDEPAGDLRRYYTEKAQELRQMASEARGDGDNITAANHEAAADEYCARALKADTAQQRSYFFDKEREFRARASLARATGGGSRRL